MGPYTFEIRKTVLYKTPACTRHNTGPFWDALHYGAMAKGWPQKIWGGGGGRGFLPRSAANQMQCTQVGAAQWGDALLVQDDLGGARAATTAGTQNTHAQGHTQDPRTTLLPW